MSISAIKGTISIKETSWFDDLIDFVGDTWDNIVGTAEDTSESVEVPSVATGCARKPNVAPAQDAESRAVQPQTNIQTTTTIANPTPQTTTPPLPTPTTNLRTECLTVSQTSTIQLSQLGCLTGGVQTARQRIEEDRTAYLQLFGQVLPNGTIIIKKPDNEAVSEGIGFAGIIYSANNSAETQATFWQIYHGRNAYFVRENGVMAWSLNPDGSLKIADSASDGDQDWIAAELMVLNKIQCGQWQTPSDISPDSLRTQIQNDLNAFWTNHIKERNGRLLFLPTNGSWAVRGDGRDIYYPNYPDPHFLKLFAAFDPSHDWTKLTNDAQALNQAVLDNHSNLGAVGQNPMPAKVFVKVAADGTFSVENYYTISRSEGITGDAVQDNEADAIRFFLRQARYAILDGDQTTQTMLNQILSLAHITNPSSAHIYAGADGAPSHFGWNSTLARASYGIAVLGSGDAEKAEKFFCTVLEDHHGQYFGEWEGAINYYYDQSLILQTLDLAFNY